MLLQYSIDKNTYKKVLEPSEEVLFLGKKISDVVQLIIDNQKKNVKITGAATKTGFAIHSSIKEVGHKKIWYKQRIKSNRGKKVRFYGNYITALVSVVYTKTL